MDNALCVYCWLEAPIIEKMVAKYGNDFNIQYFDVYDCREKLSSYAIRGTPTFILQVKGSSEGQKEFLHYGYLSQDAFDQTLCSLTGKC